MSDLEDRGAYTPFSRDQLAFDPRDIRRRRPAPLTLMASAVVLVAMGGAALMFYQSGVRGRNEPPRAIGAHVGSIKTPAVQDAKPADPGALDVYVQDRPEPGAAQPVYTPAPEQPEPRTAAAQPAPQAVAPSAKAAVASPNAQTTAGTDDSVTPAPVKPAKVAAAKPIAPKPVAVAAAQAAKPKPDAKPITTAEAGKTPDKAAVAGAQVVQIGAYSSKALAEQEFAKVRSSFAKFTTGRATHVESVQKGSATLYRAAFTGFSKAQATAFCEALKAAGRACIVR